ncbi:MAG: hypothetical protein GKR89_16500 [Candidatus Latescibacteria bacterium]|nr:hypothetical protein [Candidatus Latescibacterota bacterium]
MSPPRLDHPTDRQKFKRPATRLQQPRRGKRSISFFILVGPLALLALIGCAEKRVEIYIDQLSSPQQKVRLNASRTLVQFGSTSVAPLIERASNGSDRLQYIAAQILGQIGDIRATPFLKDLLDHSNPDVREQGVRALGQLDDPAQIPLLGTVIADDPDPTIRERAAWSLGNLRDTTAVPHLVLALDDSALPVRREALIGLRFLWNKAAVAATIAALDDRAEPIRFTAAQILGHHRTAAALAPLLHALDDSSLGVRAESARALGLLGDTTAVKPLEHLLSRSATPEHPDHQAARQALRQLTGLDYIVED